MSERSLLRASFFFLFGGNQTNHLQVLIKIKLFLLRSYVFEIYTGMQNLTCIKLVVLFRKLGENEIAKKKPKKTSTKQRLFDVILTSFWSL